MKKNFDTEKKCGIRTFEKVHLGPKAKHRVIFHSIKKNPNYDKINKFSFWTIKWSLMWTTLITEKIQIIYIQSCIWIIKDPHEYYHISSVNRAFH